jgi:hypothetical protein
MGFEVNDNRTTACKLVNTNDRAYLFTMFIDTSMRTKTAYVDKALYSTNKQPHLHQSVNKNKQANKHLIFRACNLNKLKNTTSSATSDETTNNIQRKQQHNSKHCHQAPFISTR